MEILENNKRKTALWRVWAISLFLFSLTVTYVFHLNGNRSDQSSGEIDKFTAKYARDSTFWNLEKDNWLAQQDELEYDIKNCEQSKDEDNGLKDCQEDLQTIKTKVDRHDGYLDELEKNIVSLKEKVKACNNSKNN